jgi:uncharacterized protein (DUF1800 family)/uncharacterized protein (DUF1501 family)
MANPRWTFHKPEFTGHLDICASNSTTWRRQVLTTKDRRKILNVRRVNDRWEVSIDGHVRTMVSQLRFINAVKGQKDVIVDGGRYEYCSTEEEILRGIHKVKIGINCRALVTTDLIVDFPVGYIPANSVQGLIPALGQNSVWQSISSRNPEYMLTVPITTITPTPAPTARPQQPPSNRPTDPTTAPATMSPVLAVPAPIIPPTDPTMVPTVMNPPPGTPAPILPPTDPTMVPTIFNSSPITPAPVDSTILAAIITPQPVTPAPIIPLTNPTTMMPTIMNPPPVSPAPILPTTDPTSRRVLASSCQILLPSTIVDSPLFAKTADGIWLQSDPRIDMKRNTMEEPLPDGGYDMFRTNKTSYCSNAARSFFNENKCRMSTVPACLPGTTNRSASVVGAIICGSPGEISNDLTLGDTWLDVSSINVDRTKVVRLPKDTTSAELFGRQREFIWTEAAMKAKDQLRQRVAFALAHIFSLPKASVGGSVDSTEIFLVYYDILVRNAFGNYVDILKEISFNPLNAESLSYRDSRSVANAFAATNAVFFPDENYARELMQLFTIGLFELNLDGTPVLDSTGTIPTYGSNDVLSFAKIWTGFRFNAKRANVESVETENRYDPMRIEAERRDRFPKTDLSNGYVGDYYPMCTDLPKLSFLRIGAKYRLLGSSHVPDLKKQTWKIVKGTQLLALDSLSNLYGKLCSPSQLGTCSYPSVVVLDVNLPCNGFECRLDTIHVVQVGSAFYEYVRIPCVEQSFISNGIKVIGATRSSAAVCANPGLSVASEACCPLATTSLLQQNATSSCLISGEQMTHMTAGSRCASVKRRLCDYNVMVASSKCPFVGSYWTNETCAVKVKISSNGEAAVVHDFAITSTFLTKDTPNYFKVYWEGDQYPSVDNLCGGGQCEVYEDTCICNVAVANEPVFVNLPRNASEILQTLRIGHPVPAMLEINKYTSTTTNDFKTYTTSKTCCGADTFFEVLDGNGQKKFLRNLKSTVTIAGTTFNFRNPPQFNSILSHEFSIMDAYYETEAALNHLLYHQNTPPFVAYRFIQRFGVSNPTPRYTLAVATAFKSGKYTNGGLTFGQGKYGDLEATIAAVLLDREARSVVLDKDPAHGTLREPILKVLSFMRATEFNSTVPLVELDFMDVKVGQMAYEQASVFSFFRPEYSPSELSGSGLAAPESQVMSSSVIIGLMNGLFSLVKYGLSECNGGFGAHGDCSNQSGVIKTLPNNATTVPKDIVRDLSLLLTSGRLAEDKQQIIVTEMTKQSNPRNAYQLALQLIASSPEFHSTSTTDVLSPAEKIPKAPVIMTPPNPGYKAVIHLFFVGGCDSFNVLVPSSSCEGLHPSYVETRGPIGLKPEETIPLSGDAKETQQPCSSFSIHQGLSSVQQLYDEADLLFLANVGVLTKYVNRSDYSTSTKTPLFSHNSMLDEIARLDPLKLRSGTGALGRMADLLQAKGYRTRRTSIDAPTSNLASRSYYTPPIVTLGRGGVNKFNPAPTSGTMNTTIDRLNNNTSGIYGDVWSTLLKRSITQSIDVPSILSQPSIHIFPSTTLGSRLKLAAQMIASRVSRGIDRDIYYIPFTGFDSHNEVTMALRDRFTEFNDAFPVFVKELKALGVWDNVAIIQTSEFGRTMTGNSGGGTDHGWGGNYWLAGGGVKGRRIVGQYPPTFSLDYEYNIDRGRLIPTTSWDSIFNAIAEWMGLDSESELSSMLPNRPRFRDVFPAATLFE